MEAQRGRLERRTTKNVTCSRRTLCRAADSKTQIACHLVFVWIGRVRVKPGRCANPSIYPAGSSSSPCSSAGSDETLWKAAQRKTSSPTQSRHDACPIWGCVAMCVYVIDDIERRANAVRAFEETDPSNRNVGHSFGAQNHAGGYRAEVAQPRRPIGTGLAHRCRSRLQPQRATSPILPVSLARHSHSVFSDRHRRWQCVLGDGTWQDRTLPFEKHATWEGNT